VPFANLYDDVNETLIDKKIDQKLTGKKKKEKVQKNKSLVEADKKISAS
jgi:hypothetical protein